MDDVEESKKEIAQIRQEMVAQAFSSQIGCGHDDRHIPLSWQWTIPSSDADTLREITDKFREKYPSGVIVVGSVLDERPFLIASVTDDLIKNGVNAGDIVRTISKEIDGSGGGRPNLAQAGGKNPAGLKKALDLVLPLVKEKLG